jgi:hypothetical protein
MKQNKHAVLPAFPCAIQCKNKSRLSWFRKWPDKLMAFFTDESPNIIHAGDVVNKPFYFLKYTTFASKKKQ